MTTEPTTFEGDLADVMLDLDDHLVDTITQGMLEVCTREQLIAQWARKQPTEFFAEEIAKRLVYEDLTQIAIEEDHERRRAEREQRKAAARAAAGLAPGVVRFCLEGPPRQPMPVDNPAIHLWREANQHLLNDPCSYCGGPANTLDHIVPQWSGGTNTDDNVTPACQSCNSSKGKWPLLVWLARCR